MKKIYAFAFLFPGLALQAQITISSAHLPVEGDTLITTSCLLLEIPDLEVTGPAMVWTYTEEQLVSLDMDNTTPCLEVEESPILYQFLFNNPFDPEHNADFSFGVDDIDLFGFVTFSDVYSYFQNNSDAYNMVGSGATVNGIPVPTQYDPIDVIYELPLDYEDNSSSYSEMNMDIPTVAFYKLEQTRTNVVDGWGTLELWGESYEVLRVRTTIDATDSLYLNMLKFGQSLDRPQVVEYKWLSQDFKVPVLQINTTGGFVTSVLVAKVEEEVLPSVGEESESVLAIYPVPALDRISVSHGQPGAPCAIYDLQGQLVWKGTLPADTSISVAELSSGSYTLVVSETDRMVPLRFVK